MKWIFLFVLFFSCQKQEAPSQEVSAAISVEEMKEEDCDDKAKKAQEVVITEETVKLGGQPDAGCTLEE